MIDLAPALRSYIVAYRDDQDRMHIAKVLLEDGVTTVDDIPAMLAARGRTVSRIVSTRKID